MKRRGFTLIELLVAIGIIVLLSVIALASTRSLRGSLRFSTAVNTTTALLERARLDPPDAQPPDEGVRADVGDLQLQRACVAACGRDRLGRAAHRVRCVRRGSHRRRRPSAWAAQGSS